MSYRRRTTFLLVVLFPLLMVSAGYAEADAPTQPQGSRVERFFVHAYCHIFSCKSANRNAKTPERTNAGGPSPEEGSKPASTEVKSHDAAALTPTPATPAQDAGAASAPKEDEGEVLVPGHKVVVLKPGEKLPERKHPEEEDWSTPYLPKSMKGDTYVLGKIEKSKFTRELIHVQWRELDPIDLWVIRPIGVKKPPAILYIYGFPSTNKRYRDDDVCEQLIKDGYAAIGFATALTAERFHDRPGREWFVSELQESLGTSVHDVQLILNYLGSRGDFDMSRIGVWGVGSGASIAIMAAAVDPRIKAIDLLNPWGDWPDWLAGSSIIPEHERSGYLDPRFLATVEDLEPVKWLPLLKDRHVRLQYVLEGITVTPPEVRNRMEAAAPVSAEIVHYQDTKEFADKVDFSGKRFDWIRQQVGALEEIREAGNHASEETTKATSSTKDADRRP